MALKSSIIKILKNRKKWFHGNAAKFLHAKNYNSRPTTVDCRGYVTENVKNGSKIVNNQNFEKEKRKRSMVMLRSPYAPKNSILGQKLWTLGDGTDVRTGRTENSTATFTEKYVFLILRSAYLLCFSCELYEIYTIHVLSPNVFVL